MTQEGTTIDISQITPEQRQAIRSQLEEELKVLSNGFSQLKGSQMTFYSCLNSLKTLSSDTPLSPQSQPRNMLIPLTSSLYVPAEILDSSKVIVDVGTGYFVEKKIPDACEYYADKIEYLKSNLEQLQAAIQEKRSNLQGRSY